MSPAPTSPTRSLPFGGVSGGNVVRTIARLCHRGESMTVAIAGPDPCPEKPVAVLPPGACDCHAHIFGPSDRFPYAEGRGYTPPDAPLENYLTLLDTLGFARAIVVQG